MNKTKAKKNQKKRGRGIKRKKRNARAKHENWSSFLAIWGSLCSDMLAKHV